MLMTSPSTMSFKSPRYFRTCSIVLGVVVVSNALFVVFFSVFVNGSEGDSVLVQGIIDLIYKTEEGYTILDYKTDRLDGVSPEERAKEALDRHAFQLNSYAAACEEDGLKVAHKLLYLVRYGEFVEV